MEPNSLCCKYPLKMFILQVSSPTLLGLGVQPCHGQGHLQLDLVAPGLGQPDLECFRGWGDHHLSRQPVPVFHHPCCKKKISSLYLV